MGVFGIVDISHWIPLDCFICVRNIASSVLEAVDTVQKGVEETMPDRVVPPIGIGKEESLLTTVGIYVQNVLKVYNAKEAYGKEENTYMPS